MEELAVSINPSSHVPIYLQIAQYIRQSVSAGIYRPGELLPSLRQLALDLSVNPNTVQRAYEHLEHEGLVVSRRGVGLFVTRRGDASARSRAADQLRNTLAQAMGDGLAAGLSPRQIRNVFEQSWRQVARSAEDRSCRSR